MSDLFLGLDVGTQGTKALLVDAGSRAVVARASHAYGLEPGLPPGACEQHPDVWIEAIRACARTLFATRPELAPRVTGIGVSGQQHGCVVVDARDRPLLRARLWCDTSTVEEARALSDELGRRVPVGFTASKVRHLARTDPQLWARVSCVLLPHDYVNLRLTGERASEAGDASGTGWFDPAARRVDARAAAIVDEALPRKLAPLVAADAIVGNLSSDGAEILGLPTGIPVSAGSGDNMMSAFGSGATRDGVVVVSLGTSATVFARSERALVDPDGLVAPFCDATGAWLPLVCVMNCTGVTEEVRSAFGGTHEELAREAETVAIGCDGLLWLPYLCGERVPDLPRASGALVGLRSGALSRGMLYRAAIEGVALNLAWGVERMRRIGMRVESVRVVGGAARSALWRRVLADALGANVVQLAESESAALGAALQALWAVRRPRGSGVARPSADEVAAPFVHEAGRATVPDAGATARYAEAGARFRELAVTLFGAR